MRAVGLMNAFLVRENEVCRFEVVTNSTHIKNVIQRFFFFLCNAISVYEVVQFSFVICCQKTGGQFSYNSGSEY